MKKLAKINNIINKGKTFLLSTHVNPDPDALCSELALAEYLKQLGKKVMIVNEEALSERFKFLPKASLIKDVSSIKPFQYDVAIILDCGDIERIGRVGELLGAESVVVNIDHHITNDNFGGINYVDPFASSTCEILYELFKEEGFTLNKNMALNLYAGIMTDTGCFRYDNTKPRTHEIASHLCKFSFSPSNLYKKFYESVPFNDLKEFTGVVSSFEDYFDKKMVLVELSKRQIKKFSENFDLRDAIFKYLRSIDEAEVFVILTEFNNNLTRINFRSSGRINVGRLAQSFNGGGHHNASGGYITKNIKAAKQAVKQQVKKVI